MSGLGPNLYSDRHHLSRFQYFSHATCVRTSVTLWCHSLSVEVTTVPRVTGLRQLSTSRQYLRDLPLDVDGLKFATWAALVRARTESPLDFQSKYVQATGTHGA